MENILDDFTEPSLPPSRKGVDKAIWIYAALTAIILLCYDLFLDKIFITNIIDYDFGQILLQELYLILVVIIIINLVIRKINRIAPDFDEKLYVIWGASSIFYGIFFEKIIFRFFSYGDISFSVIWTVLKSSMLISMIGGVISFMVIHRIRKKNMIIPYLVLIVFAVFLHFLSKIIS